MRIGYARKSTIEQDITHQIDALRDAGCEQYTKSKFHEEENEDGKQELPS
ncbi:Resolvase, N terminal domain [Xenorhabdus koppenhoeferi]|uniref:Resolvase, N terminal domain n=1 Tax=Xenorhabdus koppenhoeferi TaxID=351659 RepID=A0A1I7JQV5_9GAMM|nr:Resolvase, N terminal domain [Xenorhabdus koppenhoeferi]